MSNVSYKRLGAALVGLAVPLMFVAPVAAQPAPDEVSAVEIQCLNYFDISTCTDAVVEGVYGVVEADVNANLEAQGVDYVVDVGIPAETSPAGFPYDVNAIAVNPLPPLIPVPPVPGVPYQ